MMRGEAPWIVLLLYGVLIWRLSPRRVRSEQFFSGRDDRGAEPGIWLLIASAAISWIFAKSIANAATLGQEFGFWGGAGYGAYYASFVVVAVTIFILRKRGGWRSLPAFLATRYGPTCAKVFMAAVAIRLFNEIWSNTKVTALFFGPEGSSAYWLAVFAVTAFTLYYSWRGGLRASLLTDAIQMVLAAVLLVVVLSIVIPGFSHVPLPRIPSQVRDAGKTFFVLALVQSLSYGFHDPVMTDRAFLTAPRKMLHGFILAGALSGGFIFLFSLTGVYAHARGLSGPALPALAEVMGPTMGILFNTLMLASAGSTIDSAFASSAKLGARDWKNDDAPPTPRHAGRGRWAMALIAVTGNLPLLSIYLGDKIGPAVIAATTISGTMVMGLAPIFLLSWLGSAGRLSFHMAFWPGILFGVLRVVETAQGGGIFPPSLALGTGKYALDLGINVYGLLFCCCGYLAGALIARRAARRMKATA